jgi:hypothetical protein
MMEENRAEMQRPAWWLHAPQRVTMYSCMLQGSGVYEEDSPWKEMFSRMLHVDLCNGRTREHESRRAGEQLWTR